MHSSYNFIPSESTEKIVVILISAKEMEGGMKKIKLNSPFIDGNSTIHYW